LTLDQGWKIFGSGIRNNYTGSATFFYTDPFLVKDSRSYPKINVVDPHSVRADPGRFFSQFGSRCRKPKQVFTSDTYKSYLKGWICFIVILVIFHAPYPDPHSQFGSGLTTLPKTRQNLIIDPKALLSLSKDMT
jgi:hypothetical protein